MIKILTNKEFNEAYSALVFLENRGLVSRKEDVNIRKRIDKAMR